MSKTPKKTKFSLCFRMEEPSTQSDECSFLSIRLVMSLTFIKFTRSNMHQHDLQTLTRIAELIGCEKRELITE